MWYSANLIYKGINEDGLTDLCEERIVLFHALCEKDVYAKAKSFGLDSEHSYEVESGGTLQWKFDTIERVYEIDDSEIHDGSEIFSRFLTKEDVDILKKHIKKHIE